MFVGGIRELIDEVSLPILFWHSPFGYRRESFALGIVQGDDPGSVRGLFCHSERFLKGIFTPDDVGYGSSFDEKIFCLLDLLCDVGLGVLECFSIQEDAYMRMDILIVEIRHVDSLENFFKVDHTVGVIVGIGFVSGFVS